MIYAPIIVFAYNRPDKVRKLLDSLNDAVLSDKSDVFVFSDGFKGEKDKDAVLKTRKLLSEYNNRFNSFSVICRERNYGLAKSIITGVTDIIDKYGKAIVLEDDLLVSEDFVKYMNEGLEYYEDDLRYGMISAYTSKHEILESYDKDIYCMERGDCWGWATWKNRWDNVDWELKDFDKYLNDKDARDRFSGLQLGLEEQLINQHNGVYDIWAARWIFHLFNQHMLTVYPKECRAINIGLDGSGVNCDENMNSLNSNDLHKGITPCNFEKLSADYHIQRLQYDFGLEKNSWIKICINNIRYKLHDLKIKLLKSNK